MTYRIFTIIATTMVCASLLMVGCELPPKTQQKPDVAVATAQPEQPDPPPERQGRVAEPRAIPPDVNTAAKAARAVDTMPAVEDILTRREIALHEALYREAMAGMVADNTLHVLLQPMLISELPTLSIGECEFYLRVLAGLADLNRPIAWTTVEQPAHEQAEFFPGTRELATRLSFEILERDDAAATVIANVSDVTAHTGSSRQRIIATFDGRRWQTTRDGPRLIW